MFGLPKTLIEGVFVGRKIFKTIIYCLFSLIRTLPYTFAAINAFVLFNYGVSVMNTDSLGRTTLNAVGATLTS
jgi:uncharacterized membrane protein YccF (DUF307 family)